MIPSNNSAACSVCFGSGFDVAGKPCPFAPHRDAATLKAAPGGVSEAMVERALAKYAMLKDQAVWPDAYSGDECEMERRDMRAALEAALSAEPAAQGEAVALNVRHPKCHEAANAFWNYWNANGETHKRGYYESTWGAINAALRMVGVRPHDYGDAPPPDGSSPRYDDAAPPAQPADSKVIGADLKVKPAERVPEGWRVLQIGAVGSAYDPPNTRRAFTYDWQPGNGAAWALGKASSSAAKASAGDYIDGGLNLLKALQEQGFGVFQIEPSAPAAPAEEGDAR